MHSDDYRALIVVSRQTNAIVLADVSRPKSFSTIMRSICNRATVCYATKSARRADGISKAFNGATGSAMEDKGMSFKKEKGRIQSTEPRA
jgi:hypothetical protein